MTGPDRDLVAEEGVDEGSAASSTEDDSGPDIDPVRLPVSEPARNSEQDAGPGSVETLESRNAQDGQQLEAGEG